jgi:glycosyltransferase involved in cell wall biosynthesis
VAPAKEAGNRGWDDVVAAARIVNSLPAIARGHRRAIIVLPVERPAAEVIRPDDPVECRADLGDPLAALASCHVALFQDATVDRETARLSIAALACGLPVIAVDRGVIPELIAHRGREAGMLLPLTSRPSIDPDRLVAAMLAYLKQPDMYAAHRDCACQVFDERFAADRNAAACVEAYLDACNVLTFSAGGESIPVDEGEPATLPSRRLA